MLITQNLGLPARDRTPSGRIKFTAKILNELLESPSGLRAHFDKTPEETEYALDSVDSLRKASSIATQINTFIGPLQKYQDQSDGRLHYALNLNTETGRLSCASPNLQNQPSSKDIFKVRRAFTPQNENSTLIIADYAQIELRVLAYLSNCESMIEAFDTGGDFHSRTAASMYPYIKEDIVKGMILVVNASAIAVLRIFVCVTHILGGVLMDGDGIRDLPLVKDKYKLERMRAKILNFSIAYGKTAQGLATDLDISVKEAQEIVELWYSERAEVRRWQHQQMIKCIENGHSYSLIGRPRKLFDPLNDLCDGDKKLHQDFQYFVRVAYNFNGDTDEKDDLEILAENVNFADIKAMMVKSKIKGKNKKMSYLWRDFMTEWKKNNLGKKQRKMSKDDSQNGGPQFPVNRLNRYMRQAINSPVQSGAADIVVKAMLNIWEHKGLKDLGYKLLLQIHDEVILEGPLENVEEAKEMVRECMEIPWNGMKQGITFKADVKHSDNWYDGK